MTLSDTGMGGMTLDVPLAAMVMLAEADPPAGVAPGTSETVSAADPVPDAGDTCSHALFEAAVHVTVSAPVCVSLSVCAAVRNAGAPAMMPKASDARSAASVTPVAALAVAVTGMDASLRSPFTLYATTRNRYVPPAVADVNVQLVALPMSILCVYGAGEGP